MSAATLQCTMSQDDRRGQSNREYERGREDGFDRWVHDNYRRQADYRHSDHRNRANMSSNPGHDFEQRDRYRADRYAGQYGRTDHDDRDR